MWTSLLNKDRPQLDRWQTAPLILNWQTEWFAVLRQQQRGSLGTRRIARHGLVGSILRENDRQRATCCRARHGGAIHFHILVFETILVRHGGDNTHTRSRARERRPKATERREKQIVLSHPSGLAWPIVGRKSSWRSPSHFPDC